MTTNIDKVNNDIIDNKNKLNTLRDVNNDIKILDNIKNLNDSKEVIASETAAWLNYIKSNIDISGESKSDRDDLAKNIEQKQKEIEKVSDTWFDTNSWVKKEANDYIVETLWDNAFTRLLRQLSALFAMLVNSFSWKTNTNLSSNNTEETKNNDTNTDKEVKDDKDDKTISNKNIDTNPYSNHDLDKLYNDFKNYKKYRSVISAQATKRWISEYEILKLLSKENSSADPSIKNSISNAYGLWQMIPSTWSLVERVKFDWRKMDKSSAEDQIKMTVAYMQYIKERKKCSDSEIKVYYNVWHNFVANNSIVDRDYIEWNLNTIVYKNPKYNGKSVDYIYWKMTNKEYLECAVAYYEWQDAISSTYMYS